jgi:phosphodiesterase/alkaline phosphatase D-like protein
MERVVASLALPLSLGLSACGGNASAPTSATATPTPTGVVSVALTPGITEILGRPTDHSATVSARPDRDVDLYFEYGRAPGSYGSVTATARATAGQPVELVLEGLARDTRYYYRVRHRAAGSADAYATGAEHSVVTQRAAGSTFTFAAQGDSHPEREKSMFSPDLYGRTLKAVAADRPDFYLTSGDDFSVDTLKTVSADSVTERYTLQVPYLALVAHSSPLFLVNGNHEQAARYLYDSRGPWRDVPVWAQNARNRFFPQPAPDGFYSGNTEELAGIGLLRDYSAWEWGDALFVTLDPYWSSPVPVDNAFGDDDAGNGKASDRWDVTHGDAQYQWLKRTLEASRARWKFVFAHHVLGSG